LRRKRDLHNNDRNIFQLFEFQGQNFDDFIFYIERMSVQTSTINSHVKHRLWISAHECAVCGSKAIGINFGAPTCAPCKGI